MRGSQQGGSSRRHRQCPRLPTRSSAPGVQGEARRGGEEGAVCPWLGQVTVFAAQPGAGAAAPRRPLDGSLPRTSRCRRGRTRWTLSSVTNLPAGPGRPSDPTRDRPKSERRFCLSSQCPGASKTVLPLRSSPRPCATDGARRPATGEDFFIGGGGGPAGWVQRVQTFLLEPRGPLHKHGSPSPRVPSDLRSAGDLPLPAFGPHLSPSSVLRRPPSHRQHPLNRSPRPSVPGGHPVSLGVTPSRQPPCSVHAATVPRRRGGPPLPHGRTAGLGLRPGRQSRLQDGFAVGSSGGGRSAQGLPVSGVEHCVVGGCPQTCPCAATVELLHRPTSPTPAGPQQRQAGLPPPEIRLRPISI